MASDLGFGIYHVDVQHMRDDLASAYIVVEGDRAAIIETGTTPGLHNILAALTKIGLTPEQVDFVCPTHVHLDHAGGAGQLMKHCPNADLIIHPRGARHMIDPAALIAGATSVYGDEEMAATYGEILPIDAARVTEAPDEFVVNHNGRKLVFRDSPGHAKHHYVVWDEKSKGFFTGDTFGLSYRETDVNGVPYIMPTTTPVQFDPEALHRSINMMLSYQPQRMYLTHYGMLDAVEKRAKELIRRVHDYVLIARRFSAVENRKEALEEALMQASINDLRAMGSDQPEQEIRDCLSFDIELNAQGLEVWLDK
jgi:glyoxylase-like metal-dependent hydrolase (beta-lactamase superfamily II)